MLCPLGLALLLNLKILLFINSLKLRHFRHYYHGAPDLYMIAELMEKQPKSTQSPIVETRLCSIYPYSATPSTSEV